MSDQPTWFLFVKGRNRAAPVPAPAWITPVSGDTIEITDQVTGAVYEVVCATKRLGESRVYRPTKATENREEYVIEPGDTIEIRDSAGATISASARRSRILRWAGLRQSMTILRLMGDLATLRRENARLRRLLSDVDAKLNEATPGAELPDLRYVVSHARLMIRIKGYGMDYRKRMP